MMETKPKILLHTGAYLNGGDTLGMRELLHSIGESNLFDVDFHDESISAMRSERATIIYYNAKKIYLDLWEYPTPTHTMEVYNANFDLIVKIQHRDVSVNDYQRYCNRKGMMQGLSIDDLKRYLSKIVPWTFFTSKMLFPLIGKEEELRKEKYPIERDCFFCGKSWKCRHHMEKALRDQNVEYISSEQGLRHGKVMDDKKYLHYMRSSKYGLVLNGRGSAITDAKNRREIDYMILGKPLIMNFQPNYYNKLEAGKHFILIDQNTKINSLDKMYNIEEIAENGYEWYKQNATSEGMAKTFMQIMEDRLNQE